MPYHNLNRLLGCCWDSDAYYGHGRDHRHFQEYEELFHSMWERSAWATTCGLNRVVLGRDRLVATAAEVYALPTYLFNQARKRFNSTPDFLLRRRLHKGLMTRNVAVIQDRRKESFTP